MLKSFDIVSEKNLRLGKLTKYFKYHSGFGTQIIQLSTQQLNGNMVAAYEYGTSVLFQFKTKPEA